MKESLVYLIRGVWFYLKVLLMIAAVCFLIWFGFSTAFNSAQAFIICSDGMPKRAAAIIADAEDETLDKFFTEDFIAGDELLNYWEYDDAQITSYDYDLRVKWVDAKPNAKKAVVTAEERVADIQVKKDETQEQPVVPVWENRELKIVLTKNDDGAWLISELIEINKLSDETENAQ